MADQLWLLRHGDAARDSPTGTDADRPLTEQGERQSRAAGTALRALGVTFDAIYTSPKVRASETARLAAEGLDGPTPIVHEPLRDGFSLTEAQELLRGAAEGGRILVVGHNPDFARLVHDLTGARVDFKKGAVAATRDGRLTVLLRPRELEALAGRI